MLGERPGRSPSEGVDQPAPTNLVRWSAIILRAHVTAYRRRSPMAKFSICYHERCSQESSEHNIFKNALKCIYPCKMMRLW